MRLTDNSDLPDVPERLRRRHRPRSPDDVTEAMKDVVDPELGINVVDLGLVYGVHLDEDNVGDHRHDADLGGLPAHRRDRGPDQAARSRAWSTTSGSTGSGCRRGVRTRSPTTAASSCARSASTSDLIRIQFALGGVAAR